MSLQTSTSAETKIDALAKSVGVTYLGDEWLKETLDPYPDEPRKCEGYPDTVNGPSVVQKLKYKQTVTSTGGVVWDAHVFFDAWDNNVPMYITNAEGGPNVALSAVGQIASFSTGGLNVLTGPTGTALGLPNYSINLPIPDSYFNNGKTRVIAKAFEVTNTTSILNKQGAVTTYRSPAKKVIRPFWIQKNLAVPGNIGNVVNGVIRYLVPSTVTPVLNLDDTEVFSAAEGCYCVSTLSDPVIEPQDYTDSLTPVFSDSSSTAGQVFAPLISANTSGNTFNTPGVFPGKFNLSGAFFTGLSPTTSLEVTVHYLLERFVNENNLDLVVMTSKSPSFDPAALELYSRAAAYLPTGVPVGANADGDWIKNIADVLAGFGVPGMPLVKGAVDLWNGVKLNPNKGQKNAETKRIASLENKIIQLEKKGNTVSSQKSKTQPPQQPKQKKLTPAQRRAKNLTKKSSNLRQVDPILIQMALDALQGKSINNNM